MARLIGGTRTWLWWLGGLVCALLFGAGARAGEPGPVPEYGIRRRPRRIRPRVSEADKQKAAGFIDEYLKPVAATRPDAKSRKEIEKLVGKLASGDAMEVRAATEKLLDHGTAALGALHAAAKGGNRRAVKQAEWAAAAIESAIRGRIAARLRKLGGAARVTMKKRLELVQRRKSAAVTMLAQLKKAGKGDTGLAEKYRAAEREADRQLKLLNNLAREVPPGIPETIITCYLMGFQTFEPKARDSRVREVRLRAFEEEGQLKPEVAAKVRRGIARGQAVL